jgi:thioester reductase-like protein
MRSLIKELKKRVEESPDKRLYAFLGLDAEIVESYTYLEFDERTSYIASTLQQGYKLQPEARVLLAYPPGLEMICAFFACVKIGVIPVPVYPPSSHGFSASLYKMDFIAQDCDTSVVLTTKSYYWSYKLNVGRSDSLNDKSNSIKTKFKWISTDDISTSKHINYEAHVSNILFLQYTSGSTSDPKGVIVSQENIMDNFENVVDHMPIGVSWLPQYHDMGLIGYYLFFAIKGGTTYGFSPTDFIRKPSLWLEVISKYKGTASSAPNFAFEYCLAPGKLSDALLETLDLSSLKFLMNAAEPIDAKLFKRFIDYFEAYGLDPKAAFGAYGLAENTLAVTNYGRSQLAVDRESLKRNLVTVNLDSLDADQNVELMSCGRVLGDTKIQIVNPDTLMPSKHDEVGEIWVKGSSKCRGYWNREKLSQDIFNARLANSDSEEGWMRTGDIGFIYNEELYVCARHKDMLIVRGLNYYPQDIEAVIETDSEVRKGSVASFTIPENGEDRLILVVGVKRIGKLPDAKKLKKTVLKLLGISIDEICFVPARSIVKTSSGKIMRYKNKELFVNGELEILATNKFDSEMLFQNIEETKNQDENKLTRLFNSYHLLPSETQALGEIGLDSLKLAEFAHDLRLYISELGLEELSEELDLRILQRIGVSELHQLLTDLKIQNPLSKLKFKKALLKINHEYASLERQLMQSDAVCKIEAEVFNVQVNRMKDSGSILLIGGTGFFGPFLLKSLLEQTDEDIWVLIRASDSDHAWERLRRALSNLNWGSQLRNDLEKRVHVVCGDLNKNKLGLSAVDWEYLSNEITTIYHNGALVNYLLDYEAMRDSNVNGTHEVVRFACANQHKTLNYISSTFIFGWSNKDILYETDSNEKMELLDFGYSQSKWVADQIVVDAMKKGLDARIFRPALISPSIQGEGYNFDISVRLLVFMINHGIDTLAQNQVSFTPADLGANNIVAISNIKESIGKTFHVTRDEYSSMQDVTQILAKLADVNFEHFNLKDFVPEVVARCTKKDLLFPLLNFLVKSIDNISSMEFKRYDNSNYQNYRNMSEWGRQDESLTEVVTGIYTFIRRHSLINKTLVTESNE